MHTVQYTIRQIPKQLDTFLRRQARLRGRSLNQTVLDYINKAIEEDKKDKNDDLSWFIGANTIDDAAVQAIQDAKAYDKQTQQRMQ